MSLVEPTSSLAASALLAPLFDGPPVSLHVVNRCTSAVQLADEAGVVRGSAVTSAAVRFPHAVVLPKLPDEPALTVGDRALSWGCTTFSVARWWMPAQPRLPMLLTRVRGRVLDDAWLRWRDRLGEGPGLTPYADDVICGILLTLRAAGDSRADGWAAAVLAFPLKRYTSAASAAMLRLAAAGWCIDQVSDYLLALSTGRGIPAAEQALRGVGSSSGEGLIEGITAVVGGASLGAAA